MPYLFRQREFHSLLAVAAAYLMVTGECSATGRWNLPSTANQYLGIGFGAGYHAPLVMGHSWRGKAASPGVRRVPEPLMPPCCSAGMVPRQEFRVDGYSMPDYRGPVHHQPTIAPSAPHAPAMHSGPSLLFDAPAVPTPDATPLEEPHSPSEQQASEVLPVP